MASTGESGGSLPPNFFLTPHQQSLLFAALNANNQKVAAGNSLPLSPSSLKNTPNKVGDASGYQESPYLDNYDYDFGDSSFDFSFANDEQAKMIGDLPDTAESDTAENDANEKRSHPDDEDDDSSPGNDSKRHEGSEKVPKKPGRKPLTSEPTSKRKAQNRAAQRAFRERKEKHLKDLETKVEELEKASEAANHENTKLRAQVERMTVELGHYKQRMNFNTHNKGLQRDKAPFGNAALSGINDVSFQFEFPKFGSLPGPPTKKPQRSTSQPISPQQNGQGYASKTPESVSDSLFKDDLANFTGIFTPSMSNSTRDGSRASVDSANFSLSGATSSPSASSNSNCGPSSSCGTSPEPFTQSPMGFKPVETLTTIGEEQAPQPSNNLPFSQFTNAELNNIDWLAQQNGGQFDPQLFGDYREPQNNVLSNPSFDDFFNDAFDTDFATPYNVAPSPANAKKSLIEQINDEQSRLDDGLPMKQDMKNCNQIWEKLQECPKAQNGEFDLDGLCSELTKKAKCSGKGPVVAEMDFDTILKKYMGQDVPSAGIASELGIALDKDSKTGQRS